MYIIKALVFLAPFGHSTSTVDVNIQSLTTEETQVGSLDLHD